MTLAYQLLSIVALYSDIANVFEIEGSAVYCWRMAPSGRLRFIAAHGGA
jgi:hypothetical protein